MLQSVVLAIIGSFVGISQSAGIGGGPIINICLMIGLGYSSKAAMSMTYLFLMGGSLASILQNVTKRRPNGELLMNYNLITLTAPLITTGSLFGTILNSFLSELSITIAFTFLLGYLAFSSYRKFVEAREVEAHAAELSATQVITNNLEEQLKVTDLHPALADTLALNKSFFQKDKLKVLLYVIIYTVCLLLLRGGHSYSSWIGVTACGVGYWLFNITHLALSYLTAKSDAILQFKQQHEQSRFGLSIPQNQKVTDSSVRTSMFYGFTAGLIGGSLGLGGAIVLVPVWLNLGIDKDVATASSGPLIFVSSFCSVFISTLSGNYTTREFAEFFILSFLSSWLVKLIIAWITARFHLKRMVYVLLLLTMTISLVALLPYQLSKYRKNPQQFMEFGELC